MFNVPRFHPARKCTSIPHYDAAPISFAANYKEMLQWPTEWIAEFEAILRNLGWFQAVAISDFTGIRLEWRMGTGHLHDPDKPGGFKLTCSAGNLQELPYDVAIEGGYTPKL